MLQKSLVLMKPDAVKRGIVGEILHRFERSGLKIVGAKLVQADSELAEKHYPNSDEWKSKVGQRTIDDCEKYGIDLMANMGTTDPIEVGAIVKQWNVDFLTSGPVLAVVFEGVNAVERVRALVGETIPVRAAPGTIRGDFSLDSAIAANRRKRTVFNLIHASGSEEEAATEINLWFKENELFSYKRVHEDLYMY
ncbi:nucleoside-diphosphate kinase [candidate division WWE3 bacterium RIFOXYC1_FULL_39_7]|uniref:nucleoside-diphosphate kinase n=2 Tax=Katanobacteria TaxID=422282 RepID=A0A1F4X683_UNCKA|nr:MAG: nucleoside-diphosphate kinase [candidate division WWE3 bacterium RIFOXYC1_FULL_39_7]OGC77061.1 MAG: nucleoside-diphosphate kinase [candidate division WWE3 bacterium RIFOXYD1_FULL_39_9]